jgi:hypothetical protein
VLAGHRNSGCAKTEAEIVKSLQGHYKPEHVFALQQALEAYAFYQRQIKACDREIEQCYQNLGSMSDKAALRNAPVIVVEERVQQTEHTISLLVHRAVAFLGHLC